MAEVGGSGRFCCALCSESQVWTSSSSRRGCPDRLTKQSTHLVVAEQPHSRRLVVLIIGDHAVVRAHLNEVVRPSERGKCREGQRGGSARLELSRRVPKRSLVAADVQFAQLKRASSP